MRYSIGSISKQFTAAAILLLQEQGKLSLDDKVGKYVPDLTRANEVTIRQLLSHTSGYQDYWPQDYVMPMMLQPVTSQKDHGHMGEEAARFRAGHEMAIQQHELCDRRRHHREGFGHAADAISAEKVFCAARDDQRGGHRSGKTRRHRSDRLSAIRPRAAAAAPKEGKGWLFAAGELAMPAQDLAKWDISIMDQNFLKPASYREIGTDTLLKNGVATNYGLGVSVNMQAATGRCRTAARFPDSRRKISCFPDERRCGRGV